VQIVDLEPAAQVQPDEDRRHVAVAALAKCTIGEEEPAAALRDAGDALETVVPQDLWPLPTYREMLFVK